MGIDIVDVDSELGRWYSARWTPGEGHALRGTLARIWYFDGALTKRSERVFPRGVCEMIVQLDEPHRPPGGSPFPALTFGGLQTRSFVVVAPVGRIRVLGVQFEPLGACAVLGRPLRDVAGASIALEDVTSREAAERLHEACVRAPSGAAVVAAAIAWCEARFVRTPESDPALAAVTSRLRRARGNASIARAISGIGRSERALTRSFREMVGMSPKRYARILRFERAQKLVADERIALADVAARAGFYDQAHFTTDFREHAGMSPAAYRSRTRFPGGVSMAED